MKNLNYNRFILQFNLPFFSRDKREHVILGLVISILIQKNTEIKNNILQFVDVSQEAGLKDIIVSTFPIWFWDYNNGGWLDIFACSYGFGVSMAHTACTEALNIPNKASFMYL